MMRSTLLLVIALVVVESLKLQQTKRFVGNLLLGTMGLGLPIGLTPAIVNAAPLRFLPSSEQSAVDAIASYQLPIFQLQEQLKTSPTANAVGIVVETQVLKDGPEDSAVVLVNMETYIKPLQKKMEGLAPSLATILEAKEDKERVILLPQLMKGHILELTEAIKSQKSAGEKKEVDEVQETLAEFLKISGKAKFDFEPLIPPRPLTDKELFGPLGCEFWGKKRIAGSNACSAEDLAGREAMIVDSATPNL